MNKSSFGIKKLLVAFICILMATVISCGDSYDPVDEPDPDLTTLPVAVLNANFETVEIGSWDPIILDGRESYDSNENEITEYKFEQIDGYDVELFPFAEVQFVLLPPENEDEELNELCVGNSEFPSACLASVLVPNVETTLVFQLTVTNELGVSSEPVEVEISVVKKPDDDPDDPDVPLTEVYVSANSGLDDSLASGTWKRPVKTISRGIEIAQANNLDTIYVMQNTYEETIVLTDGINLVGGVESFNDGDPIIANDVQDSTIIKSPSDENKTITINQASDVHVSNFTIEGNITSVDMLSSEDIVLENVVFKTSGNSISTCRDLNIKSSVNVTLENVNSLIVGGCNAFVGVDVNSESSNIDLSGTSLELPENSSDRFITVIEIENSENVNLAGVKISGESVSETTEVTSILISDSQVDVRDVDIDLKGGASLTGVSIKCADIAPILSVAQNSIKLDGSYETQTGVDVFCMRPNAEISVTQNFMNLRPVAGALMGTSSDYTQVGVKVATNYHILPIKLNVVNNIIILSAASGDRANKAGIDIGRVGINSEFNVYHNNVLMESIDGRLRSIRYPFAHSISLDMVGNIFMVNSLVESTFTSMHTDCYSSWCITRNSNNLFNDENAMAQNNLFLPSFRYK